VEYCPIALEEAIIDRMTKNKKIKAITVNLYGMPYKVDEVHAIAENMEFL
jgi:dTDP-4-amino-4,6-dideoxygalactose transaminase